MTGPFAYPRPYWTGYNREQDEKLVRKLFYGTTIRDKQTGRDRHKYLTDDSPEEREGRQALCRLLCHSADPEILAVLCRALDGSLGRRLVFKNRKGGKRDDAADFQVALHVESLRYWRGGKPKPLYSTQWKNLVYRERQFLKLGSASDTKARGSNSSVVETRFRGDCFLLFAAAN